EILSSLQYAKQNANNKKLLQKIVSKAACFEGLSHREAITLLECEDKEILSEIYKLAKEIKQLAHLYDNMYGGDKNLPDN
ncbi:hypothetical protein, partial [Klebsiella pneumoniae]|uniref:hypothetical protein n=1 Tax=Klebsiella pneumoniae TaxID=573 RepID=UPI00272EF0E1